MKIESGKYYLAKDSLFLHYYVINICKSPTEMVIYRSILGKNGTVLEQQEFTSMENFLTMIEDDNEEPRELV